MNDAIKTRQDVDLALAGQTKQLLDGAYELKREVSHGPLVVDIASYLVRQSAMTVASDSGLVPNP